MERADDLRRSASRLMADELCEAAVSLHALTARVSRLAGEVDATGAWRGDGFRSCAHWLSLEAGFDLRTAEELVRVGGSLRSLPRCGGAAATGELSFDKLRAITLVATPQDEEVWVELARQASGGQLVRICREYRRARRLNSPDRAEAQERRRGLWRFWDEDGMLNLTARLPSEDGALVLNAIERITQAWPRQGPEDPHVHPAVPDPADDRPAARAADALVSICEASLRQGAPAAPLLADAPEEGASAVRPPRGGGDSRSLPTLIVHVEVGALTGADPDAEARLLAGPALPASALQRLGCDADVTTVITRNGSPIDVGRRRRIVSTRLRRALEARDGLCRFPGCAVPVRMTHAHHIRHWAHGGRTDLANLVSLCGFHHRRLHDGCYSIVAEKGGGFRFEREDGSPIAPEGRRTWLPAAPDQVAAGLGPELSHEPAAARARDGGRLSMGYAISVLCDSCDWRRQRATEARAGP